MKDIINLTNLTTAFSVRFCDNLLLVLKMRFQVFSFASKTLHSFSSARKILRETRNSFKKWPLNSWRISSETIVEVKNVTKDCYFCDCNWTRTQNHLVLKRTLRKRTSTVLLLYYFFQSIYERNKNLKKNIKHFDIRNFLSEMRSRLTLNYKR